MATTVEHQIETLERLCLPRASSVGWDPAAARVGLTQLRRIQGELDALRAVFVGVLKTETGRDTKATLVRAFGMSSAEAAKTEQVAAVAARVPGALDALADGSVTGEHLRRLTPITDAAEAEELLAVAAAQPADDFAKTVDQWRIDRNAKGWRDRQHNARSLKFFKADNGCVGMRVILPTVEGEQVKAAINEACDATWRTAHPERAETSGGHDDEPREARLADALVSLVTGTATNGARTAVIVTMQAETLQATLLGTGPIPTCDALALVDDPRTDVYAAIQDTDGAILKFGRSRRLATAIQKLALALREGGTCAHPGCDTRWNRCDADHDPPWDNGGLTDINTMRLLCKCEHHPHRHETDTNITRQPNGTWTVNGETMPSWPPNETGGETCTAQEADTYRSGNGPPEREPPEANRRHVDEYAVAH